MTEEGKTKVSMVFKSSEMIQVTRLRVRVSAIDGLIYLGLVIYHVCIFLELFEFCCLIFISPVP